MYEHKSLKVLGQFQSFKHRFNMPTRIESFMQTEDVYCDYYLAFNDLNDAFDANKIVVYKREWRQPKVFIHAGTLGNCPKEVRVHCLLYLQSVVQQIKQGAA